MEQLEHLLLKAATTVANDQGIFEAVISAASIDRERDIVDPQGFVNALHQWIPLGKKIPLAWNHGTRPQDIIGSIDPSTARVVGDEVVASGWIDQSTDNGAHAWRLVKSGTLGFSFGYLVPQGGSTPRKGGGRHIRQLDIFEVTATASPMNGDTRVLGWKGVKASGTVGPGARHHLENLIRYYMGKPHPFTSCTHDNAKRFGPEGADKVCATLKDIGTGTTHWRHGGNHGKAVDTAATTDAAPSDQDMEAMCQSLYDAAGGNLEALLEMWWAHMQDNGDTPKALSPEDTVREAGEISREFALRGAHKQADTDSEDEGDPAELLGGMIATAQDFIDDEDDPNDVAVMRQVMVLLLRLQSEEATEPPEQDDTGKSIPGSDVVRDEARRMARMFPRTDSSAAELEALRAELAERTKRLESAQEELASARKQLSERGEDLDMLKRAGDALTLDAVRRTRRRDRKSTEKPDLSEWVVPAGELEGAKNGSLKAVWTTAYVNNLPDSSFLLVESGGDKDSEGKTTPRSLRHFPYKDANGTVDLPHLRNAIARIPQSNFPADAKEKLQARAQRILDNQKALAVDPDVAVDVTGQEPSARSVDPLVQQARALALEFQSKGISRRKPPREEKPAPARPELDEDELRREMRDLMFTALQAR